MAEDQQSYQRALNASLIGFVVQLVVFGMLLALALMPSTSHAAATAACWYAAGGLLIWLCTSIVFKQHRLERLESLESEQLAARKAVDSSLFETAGDELAVAKRRLEQLHRYLLPLVSLVTATYLIGVGIWQAQAAWAELAPLTNAPKQEDPSMALALVALATFAAFVMSRWLAGMSRVSNWQLIRGGAGYLMGNVIVGASLGATYAMLRFDVAHVGAYVTIAIPSLMIVLGVEIILNFILDIYRPRVPGEFVRPAFDSRLLSLVTSPESIAKTINDAINYQFGFELTRSWFWILFSRSVGWLVLVAIVVIWLMSSMVYVEPHQRAIVTLNGAVSGDVRGPGLHFKAPWPFGARILYDTSRLLEVNVGSGSEAKDDVPILWTNEHAEMDEFGESNEPALIVAPPITLRSNESSSAIEGDAGSTPSVSLLAAEVRVVYRIANLMEYFTRSVDADGTMRDLAESIVSIYFAGHDVDTLLGIGRNAVSETLKTQIQKRVDEAKIGIEVVSVLVPSIHPPQKSAEAFHEVVGAQQEKETTIQRAQQDAIKTLVEVAGTKKLADDIVQGIEALEKLRRDEAGEDVIAEKESDIEALLLQAGGEASQRVANARAHRWKWENSERGKALRFEKELLAYQKAPSLYRIRRYLEVIASGMADTRKFVLIGNNENISVRLQLEEEDAGFGSIPLDLGNPAEVPEDDE